MMSFVAKDAVVHLFGALTIPEITVMRALAQDET
jgi:hypothetical protein